MVNVRTMSDVPEGPPGERDSDAADADDGGRRSVDDDGKDSAGEAPEMPDWEAAELASGDGERDRDEEDLDELRREVEEKYDFENFGPADMAEMTVEEWEVAFDPETWITGEELLDRLEDDLATRVANREVFARIEREDDPQRLVAYSDEGYAVVYPDGSVTGEGTVLRDVKPSVALSSMDSYDVPEPPADATLPEPEAVPEQSGELGNLMLQVIAGMQLLAALVLFGAGAFAFTQSRAANAWLLFAAGIGFLIVGVLLFFTVANARLSDAFRAEEYRNRLRAIGSSEDGRPDFVPPEAAGEGDEPRSLAERIGADSPDAGDGDGADRDDDPTREHDR